MTYFINAHTNDKARLLVSEHRTTDFAIAEIIITALKARGYIVFFKKEG